MFNIKTWIDRVSEFPTRRLLTKVSDGTSEQVIVSRDEGTVTTSGDTFDANTMNNLEARIASAFTVDDQKMGDLADLETTDKSSLVAAINEAAQSGGGGGGSSTLAGLTDVDINLPVNGQVLKYDALNDEWVNANEGSGGSASSVSYDNTNSGLAALNVQAAIDEVAGDYVKKDNAIIEGTASIMATSTNDAAMNATGNDTHGANMGVYNSEVDGSMHMNMSTTGVKELVVYDGNAVRSVLIAQDAAGNYSGDLIDMIDAKADAADLADKADIASPAFTGMPTAPTPTAGDDSTKIATTTFVQTSHEYQRGESISIAGMLCPFWQTGSTVRIFVPLTKTIASDVTASSITQTGNFEIRSYQGTAIATNHPLSDYGTVTFYKLAGGIGILISNLNSTWGDASRYTTGFAYANSGNTIKLGNA